MEVNGKPEIRESTKTGKPRWVPIDPSLLSEVGEGKGWRLGTSKGTSLHPRNLAREWTALAIGTEFRPLTLHNLRSTFGTLMLESGVDVRTASEMLDHSPAMLATIYAWSRKDLKKAALGRVFGPWEVFPTDCCARGSSQDPLEVSNQSRGILSRPP